MWKTICYNVLLLGCPGKLFLYEQEKKSEQMHSAFTCASFRILQILTSWSQLSSHIVVALDTYINLLHYNLDADCLTAQVLIVIHYPQMAVRWLM